TNASSITTFSGTYDTAGRAVTTADALSDATTVIDAGSLPVYPYVRTTTLPNAGERIESFARNGTLLSVTGSGAHPVRYTNGFISDGGSTRYFTAEIKLNTNGADLAEAVTNIYDLAGRVYKTAWSAGSTSAVALSYYNARGQL